MEVDRKIQYGVKDDLRLSYDLITLDNSAETLQSGNFRFDSLKQIVETSNFRNKNLDKVHFRHMYKVKKRAASEVLSFFSFVNFLKVIYNDISLNCQ